MFKVFFGIGDERWGRKFVSREEMRASDIPDVSPVEEVGVVSNLEVRLTAFVDLVKTCH